MKVMFDPTLTSAPYNLLTLWGGDSQKINNSVIFGTPKPERMHHMAFLSRRETV
jgi:hypothetical protein